MLIDDNDMRYERDYIPIAGTWDRRKDRRWHKHGSAFDSFLTELGWQRHARDLELWDTTIGGVFGWRGHQSWQFGGELLARHIDRIDVNRDAAVIAHSHGGQVAAYAACKTRIGALITIDTPPRADMEEKWEYAMEQGNIGLHVHLHGTGWGSKMRVFGSGLSSWLTLKSFRRAMPTAHISAHVRGGHSGIIRDAKHIPIWETIVGEVEFLLRDNSPARFDTTALHRLKDIR